jgi:hypothetical protein
VIIPKDLKYVSGGSVPSIPADKFMETFNRELETLILELIRDERIGAKESSQLRKTLENAAAVTFFGGPTITWLGTVAISSTVGLPVLLGSAALFTYVTVRGMLSDSGSMGRVYKLKRSDFEKRKALFNRLEVLLADRMDLSDKIQLLHLYESPKARKLRQKKEGDEANQSIRDQVVISTEELDAMTAAFPKNAAAIRAFIEKLDAGSIQPEEEIFDVDEAAEKLFQGRSAKDIEWLKNAQELTIIDTNGLFEDLVERTLQNIYVKQDLYMQWLKSVDQANPVPDCSSDVYGEYIKRQESEEARFFEQRLKEYFSKFGN